MNTKQLLKTYLTQNLISDNVFHIWMIVLITSLIITSFFIPNSASRLIRLCIVLMTFIFSSSIAIGLYNYCQKGKIVKYKQNIKDKITSADDIKFLLMAKNKLIQNKTSFPEEFKSPIYFHSLNKELQKDVLHKFNKQDFKLFNDFDQIYKTTVFKEVLAAKYPSSLHSKLFIKLNSMNSFKFLKDIPKTKIEDFLEDRVKKTIA